MTEWRLRADRSAVEDAAVLVGLAAVVSIAAGGRQSGPAGSVVVPSAPCVRVVAEAVEPAIAPVMADDRSVMRAGQSEAGVYSRSAPREQAASCYLRGDDLAAITMCTEVIEQSPSSPDSPEVYRLRARAYLRLQRPGDAWNDRITALHIERVCNRSGRLPGFRH